MEGGGELRFQRIEDEIGLPLAAIFLVDQGHDASEAGRGGRGAADSIDLHGTAGVGLAIAILITHGVVAVVGTVGREEGNVRDVANAVGGTPVPVCQEGLA